MGKYFSIDLQGSGTADVESFGSFLHRLAFTHGVTVGQLLNHMAGQPECQARLRRIPKYLFWAESLAICNYGEELRSLVTVVSLLTGIKDLQTSTFLFLQSAMSKKGCWVVRKTRAWCPACYRELKGGTAPIYDKLLWASQYVSRCPMHEVQLLERCPKCNQPQRYGTTSDIDKCVECSASLIGDPQDWKSVHQPGLGETDVVALIGWAVESGESLDPYALSIFLTALRRGNSPSMPMASDIRSVVGERTVARQGKPTLLKCIQLAADLDVPLKLIFQDPNIAASIVTLNVPKRPRLPKIPSRRLSKANQERLKSEIVRIIMEDKSEVPPAVQTVCHFLGVEDGWFRNRYPSLHRKLARRRKVAAIKLQNDRNRRVRIALQHGLYAKYLRGEIATKDHLVDQLVTDCGISKSCARWGLSIFEIKKPKPRFHNRPEAYPW